ncbi:MAG: transposase, partial [Conexivisphaerales archaeon]
PVVKKLEMRIDGELFKVEGDRVRVTLQPGHYAYVPINTENKHFLAYSKDKASELLLTDNFVCITFTISEKERTLGGSFVAQDLNFSTIDSTFATVNAGRPALKGTDTQSISNIAHIQNDFSRRRKSLQKNIHNRQKKYRKLRQARGRQKNRVNDALQKLTTEMVKENPGASFVFENLNGIRTSGNNKGRKFRTKLNRWPYRLYQKMIEYKSSFKTVYVNPRGTSSKCPVCGDKLKHPAWGISKCETCGVDYDRDRLASLAITLRGLRLCGYPFTVSADASWPSLKDEYLYTGHEPKVAGAGLTEKVNAPNDGYKKL